VPIIDLQTAAQKARTEDLDGAIALTRNIIAEQFETGATLYLGAATTVLVESLLRRGRGADLDDAQAAIDSLAAVPTDPGFMLYELPLLRMRAYSRGHVTTAATGPAPIDTSLWRKPSNSKATSRQPVP
jgi:adenylate cyclase